MDVSYLGPSASMQMNPYTGADRQLWKVYNDSGYTSFLLPSLSVYFHFILYHLCSFH